MKTSPLLSTFDHRFTLLEVKQTCARLEAAASADLWAAWLKLLLGNEGRCTINAAWVASHLKVKTLLRLRPHLEGLADCAMNTHDSTLRRLWLTTVLHLLEQLLPRSLTPAQAEARLSPTLMKLLDFCMQRIAPTEENTHLPALCIKLAMVITHHFPEVQCELKALLHGLDDAPCSPAIAAAQRNALKAMAKKRL